MTQDVVESQTHHVRYPRRACPRRKVGTQEITTNRCSRFVVGWCVDLRTLYPRVQKIVEGSRKKKHEAAVRAILAQIEDPYADPPAGMTSDDLAPCTTSCRRSVALLGARPKTR